MFSSTAVVYAPSETPLTENAPTRPESPYARTKLAAEELLRDLAAADRVGGFRSCATSTRPAHTQAA